MENAKATIDEVAKLPAFMTAKEINQKLLHISEIKLYEMLNSDGCPKIMIGRKFVVPTQKFINWLEGMSCNE